MAIIIRLCDRRPDHNFRPSSFEATAAPGAGLAQLDVAAFVHALDLCSASHAHDAAPTLDAAVVVRGALRWTRRRGRALSSLPELIRLELEAHCRAGNATALMLRNWISGASAQQCPMSSEPDSSLPVRGAHTGDAQGSGECR